MTNLLKETLEILKAYDKTPSDVLWVGTLPPEWKKDKKRAIGSWDDFATLADFNYDSGYGSNEVQSDLFVVGDGWWLERGEYDGSEWWEFKTLPTRATDAEPLGNTDLLERP